MNTCLTYLTGALVRRAYITLVTETEAAMSLVARNTRKKEDRTALLKQKAVVSKPLITPLRFWVFDKNVNAYCRNPGHVAAWGCTVKNSLNAFKKRTH
jgi:hypothetical protein